MDWVRLKEIWPHAEYSRFIPAGRHGGRWHVQVVGHGPDLLLIHGAGGATQSWRALIPLLAQTHRCIAIDLPGQGFSRPGKPGRYGLDPMARDIAALVRAEGWAPEAIIGHSAGGALALRLAEEEVAPGGVVIGINAALSRFEGVAGWAFPLTAQFFSMNPFSALVFSNAGSMNGTVRRMLESTGSQIDETGLALYQALVANPRHVDGTLRMMAAWNLDALIGRLPRNGTRTVLLAAGEDGTVPPSVSHRAAALLPNAHVIDLPGLGHLVHEEAPQLVAHHVREALGVPADSR